MGGGDITFSAKKSTHAVGAVDFSSKRSTPRGGHSEYGWWGYTVLQINLFVAV